MKSSLHALWYLAVGIGLGAALALTYITYTGRFAYMFIWLSLFVIGAGLTAYTVRIGKPRKKKLPVRRASRVVKPRNVRLVK